MSFLELIVIVIVTLLVIPAKRWPHIAYRMGMSYRYVQNRLLLLKNQYQAWLHEIDHKNSS